jgi:hypothetical protein
MASTMKTIPNLQYSLNFLKSDFIPFLLSIRLFLLVQGMRQESFVQMVSWGVPFGQIEFLKPCHPMNAPIVMMLRQA